MSITDELRAFAKRWPCTDYVNKDMNAIADRIDTEHESACGEAYDNGVQSVALPDMTAYVKLPLDADGEYIRIGDVMEWVRYEDDDPTIVRNVAAVGAGVFFAWSDEQGRYAQYEAHAYRHHHAPTVEDVLREMADRCYADEDEPRDRDAIVAEFAAKLRLAGDAS